MILIKQPFTPVVFTSATKQFNVYGRSFFKITNVYLSGTPYSNTTFFNPFSAIPKLSATYPGFSAIRLTPSSYKTNNETFITFTMPSAIRPGLVDVIVENPAGYGKLTQFTIKEVYSTNYTQNDLRPWSTGIQVLTAAEPSPPSPYPPPTEQVTKIYSINGDQIITIDGDNIITIQ
jgi:hypothetical protein